MTAERKCLVAQQTFRTLLQAMSHPGEIFPLPREQNGKSQMSGPEGLMMILQTLLDHEVSFCVVGAEKEQMEASISRLTGCPAALLSDADFLVVPGGESNRLLLQAKRGTLEYPDVGATVIYAVESLDGNGAGVDSPAGLKPAAVLKGPGVKDEMAIAISGLGATELADINEMTSEFPMGVDCVFADRAGRVMCIPRSTRIEVR